MPTTHTRDRPRTERRFTRREKRFRRNVKRSMLRARRELTEFVMEWGAGFHDARTLGEVDRQRNHLLMQYRAAHYDYLRHFGESPRDPFTVHSE